MKKQTFEVWKAIQGYEGLYEVSNRGRVKSLERTIIRSNGRPMCIKERILEQIERNDDYLYVNLHKNGVGEPKSIHQLVATAFLPNPHGYTDVHHKNHNPKDNRVENLVWMDGGEHTAIHSAERAKRVDQIDKVTGEVLHQWISVSEVEKQLGFNKTLISECCNGGFHSKSRDKWINVTQAYGFIWKYVSL